MRPRWGNGNGWPAVFAWWMGQEGGVRKLVGIEIVDIRIVLDLVESVECIK